MRLKSFLVAAFLFVTAAASAQQMPKIPVDPTVRMGKLSNGLTYYIKHNNWPEHVANFYIAQRVGSIQEDESQRGLAHFLEHMAFNGSEHFPDSTLLEYTRSLGVEFGSDLNAYTSIDRTVYRICDVPTKRQSALDSCLLILKDWSNGLTLDGNEIDKERGVIHQEWQLRSSAQQRIFERVLPQLYPGSKYGTRLPIGLMSVVDNFKYKELRDYYHKWYRPDNQGIIIVGDVDVDHMENLIKQYWKDAKVPANAAKVVDEQVPDNDKAIYVFDKDKEMQFSTVEIAMKQDAVPDSDKTTIAYMMDQYAKQLITMMFNQRLSEETQKADCPFVDAGGYYGQYIYSKTKDAFNLTAYAKDGKDLETLAALYREAQRVRDFGFTPGEFDRAKAEYMSQLESQYNNRNKTKNSYYGNELTEHYLENEPMPSIEQEYQIMKQLTSMPVIGVDQINAFAKELISNTDTNLVVDIFAQEKAGKTYPTTDEMAQTIAKVRSEKLTPYVDNAKNEPLLDETKLPKAGKVVATKENKTFGYKELTLSNGARVILKKTDFKENEIRFQGMSKGGTSLYGKNDYANLHLFIGALASSGLGDFTNQQVQKALYGKQCNVGLGLNRNYQTISGTTVPKDLETFMQLVYLNMTSASKDTAAVNAMMNNLELMLKNKDLNPESVYGDSVSNTIYGHNWRNKPLEVKDLKNFSYDRVMQMWKERYANPGQFVYYFIGNFDEAKLIPLIEKYIGCLPKGKAENWKETPYYANGNIKNAFTRKMETPKAIAFEFWHMPMAYNVQNDVLADAAAQVLSMVYLKSIREDASAAYSVGAAGALARKGDKAFAVMQAYCPMDPNKSDEAIKLLAQGFKDNTVKVDADKVQKVKDYMLKNHEEELKSNNYWMDVIDEYVWTNVDLMSGYKAAVQALTPEKIANYLKQLLNANNHAEVVMTPAK